MVATKGSDNRRSRAVKGSRSAGPGVRRGLVSPNQAEALEKGETVSFRVYSLVHRDMSWLATGKVELNNLEKGGVLTLLGLGGKRQHSIPARYFECGHVMWARGPDDTQTASEDHHLDR